jgi:hypothetical protein
MCLGLSTALAAGIVSAADLGAIERGRLFEPTLAELRQEVKGQIYIRRAERCGYCAAVVWEFERVESMMCTGAWRIRHRT